MSNRRKLGKGRKRELVVVARGVRRLNPDYSRLTRVSIDFHLADVERQAMNQPKTRRLQEPGDTDDAA